MSDADPTPSRPTLAQVLHTTFDPSHSAERFTRDLAGLTVAMTTAPEAFVLSVADGEVLASSPADATLSSQLSALILAGVQDTSEPQQVQGALHVSVALPGAAQGILVLRLGAMGNAIRGLAFERLVSLSQLSFSTYRHPDMIQLETLVAGLSSEGGDLGKLASDIRNYVDADLVALASYENGSLKETVLSDQPVATRRATMPEKIGEEISGALSGARHVPGVSLSSNGDMTTAISAKQPRRNEKLLPVLVQALANGRGQSAGRSRKRLAPILRLAAGLLIAVGVLLIPLPDARRVPAEVFALESRTITAPLTGVILSISVSDGEEVQAEASELLRMATNEITQELAGAQADYARALLERESARGARDATALRSAELEAETLRARIDLLEGRRARAQVLSPIDGVVVGTDLDTFTGSTVRQGDPLLDVVDPDQLALRLEVPDDLLLKIADAEAGLFRPDFAPEQSFEGAVLSISPAQSTRSDIAVFEGRASLPEDVGQLRPGLRGVFVFDRNYRLLGQIIYDAIRNWVLLKLWL